MTPISGQVTKQSKLNTEIVLTGPDGREVATLTVETMERDTDNPKERVVPTESFWITLNTKYNGTAENSAEVYVK